MCALALDPQTAPRPSSCAITVVDPGGVVFQRLRRAAFAELGSALALVSGLRALDFEADLRIVVLGPLREWSAVGRLCAAGPTLVLGTAVGAAEAFAAIEAGARGCLDLGLSDQAICAAIRGILAGEVAFSRMVLGAWLDRQVPVGSRAAADARLTPRQRQIVALIAQGASDREIGGSLGIATATAQKHVSNLLGRLGAPNRAAAVALSAGLLRSAASNFPRTPSTRCGSRPKGKNPPASRQSGGDA